MGARRVRWLGSGIGEQDQQGTCSAPASSVPGHRGDGWPLGRGMDALCVLRPGVYCLKEHGLICKGGELAILKLEPSHDWEWFGDSEPPINLAD